MNRPVQMKITDEELWGEVPLAATFENVQVGYDLLVLATASVRNPGSCW
jgi:hypothetical protein